MTISKMQKFVFACLIFLNFQTLFGQNDWENPKIIAQNKEEPRATFVHFEDEKNARNLDPKKSKYYQSLNGNWKFHYSENPDLRPKNFQKDTFNIEDWKEIPVPSNWELNGYGTPIFLKSRFVFEANPPKITKKNNPVGSYRHTFEIPDDWKNRRTFIHFGAVSSAMYLWINGEKVGYSQGNKTPAEFDISKYLHTDGQPNTLAVQVFKYSDGSYLEAQDDWQLTGIERDVYLLSEPKVRIRDFYANTQAEVRRKNGILNLEVKIDNQSKKGGKYTLEAYIYDKENNPIDTAQTSSLIYEDRETTLNLRKYTPNVNLWSAENPNLYKLVVFLKQNGKTVDIVSTRIGYRTLSLMGGMFSINQKRVLLKGVNRYEFDSKTGHVISRQAMIRDIKLMKKNHINAVRTSHCPSDPLWYELCDEYGIYVIDEANLKTEGMSKEPNQTLANNSAWENAYIQRVKSVMERDKNHPSVILWALGNEAGFGQNHKKIHQKLKRNSYNRLMIYEGAGRSNLTDVVCPNSPSLEYLEDFFRTSSRPFIIGKWENAQGTSLGNLQKYWDLGMKNQNFGGIFIGNWAERSLTLTDSLGKKYDVYKTGNDSIPNDENAPINGLVYANREPHSHLNELRKIYQPIDFELINPKTGVVKITNNFEFRNPEIYKLTWQILENGKPLDGVDSYNNSRTHRIMAGQSKEVTLRRFTELFHPKPNKEYHLNVQFLVLKPDDIFTYKYVISEEQFKIPNPHDRKVISWENMPAISMRDLPQKVKVSTDKMALEINKKSGLISSLIVDNQEFLKAETALNFWRPPTDNDRKNWYGINHWEKFSTNHITTKITEIQAEKINAKVGRVTVTGEILGKKNQNLMDFQQIYTVYGSGDILLNTKYFPNEKNQSWAKIGYQFKLDKGFNKLNWFGLGEHATYADRKASGKIGNYTKNISQLFENHLVPQENTNRSDVRWAVTSFNNFGLFVQGEEFPLNVSAHNYDPQKIAESTIQSDLAKEDYTVLNADYQMAGLGNRADNAIWAKPTQFTLRIKPFKFEAPNPKTGKKGTNPQDFADEKIEDFPTEFLPPPYFVASENIFNKPMNVTLHCADTQAKIYYTLNGDEPTKKSILYDGKPINLSETTTLKMRALKSKSIGSYIVNHKFHFVNLEQISYKNYPEIDGNAPFILMDGKFGNPTDTEQNWQGFAEKNTEITIKLAKAGALKKMRFRFLENQKLKAFAPSSVIMEVSEDGKTFEKVYDYVNDEPNKLTNDISIKEFTEEIDVKSRNIKFIRLKAEQIGICPSKHPKAGERTWLFLDEIMVVLKE